MPSLGIMAHTTMPPQQHSPMGGQANFYINDCGDLRLPQPLRATEAPSPSASMTFLLSGKARSKGRSSASRKAYPPIITKQVRPGLNPYIETLSGKRVC